MVCPVVNGGVGLQMWRVVVNFLNKQSQTADKGWSYSVEGCMVGACYEMLHRALDFGLLCT